MCDLQRALVGVGQHIVEEHSDLLCPVAVGVSPKMHHHRESGLSGEAQDVGQAPGVDGVIELNPGVRQVELQACEHSAGHATVEFVLCVRGERVDAEHPDQTRRRSSQLLGDPVVLLTEPPTGFLALTVIEQVSDGEDGCCPYLVLVEDRRQLVHRERWELSTDLTFEERLRLGAEDVHVMVDQRPCWPVGRRSHQMSMSERGHQDVAVRSYWDPSAVRLDSGMQPRDAIETAIVGHAELLTAAASLDDDQIRQPSLLPDWSRARVIAHLAHKSWSHVAVFEGAVVGDVRAQYPQGLAAAEAETESWSRRSAGSLRESLQGGFDALEHSWGRLPDNAWMRRGVSSAGERSMSEFVERHLRDVFVHYADLGIGYGPGDWPAAFVRTELTKRLRDLPGRAEPNAILAWLLGRTPAPELTPW